MPIKFSTLLTLFLFFLALAFPSFYFAYKFADPNTICHDFFQYYRLYNNWDWSNVNAPFNMRLISSFLVFLFNKLGIYYNTASGFDKYIGYGFDKSVYFSAMFFNYLCVAGTSTLIFLTIKTHLKNNTLALVAGLLYLLGFGTIFYEIMPGTDSFSVVLFATVYFFYLKESRWTLVLLALAVLQREYILLAMGLVALLDFVAFRRAYFLQVMLVSIAGFLVYFILRSTIFYTPALSFQTSPTELLHSLFSITFPLGEFFRQTFMTLNLFIPYLLVIIYKYVKKVKVNRLAFVKLCLLLVQVIVLSFAAVLGNNAGRYFYILTPLLIFELMSELKFVFELPVPQASRD